ncbi:MAG: hypothetical protein PF450_01745 [Bacteroidales bacterium]|jgi:hypothetical protein|nr:hypothetical protein [Bacteroidales bacterium]
MDEYLHRALAIFSEKYHPAEDITQSTHLFSTTEIFQALNELNPGAEISIDVIFELMEEAGYTWLPDPNKMGFSLKWMVASTG